MSDVHFDLLSMREQAIKNEDITNAEFYGEIIEELNTKDKEIQRLQDENNGQAKIIERLLNAANITRASLVTLAGVIDSIEEQQEQSNE